jgi:hypothetical protein
MGLIRVMGPMGLIGLIGLMGLRSPMGARMPGLAQGSSHWCFRLK